MHSLIRCHKKTFWPTGPRRTRRRGVLLAAGLMKKSFPDKKGQTVIETVFMLIILIAIFLLIAEVARAWHLKNSLNNAVRVGARFAVVQTTLVTDDSDVVEVVRATLGRPAALVDVDIVDKNGTPADVDAGDMVTVTAKDCFVPVVKWELGFISDDDPCGPAGKGMYLTSIASMRYEL